MLRYTEGINLSEKIYITVSQYDTIRELVLDAIKQKAQEKLNSNCTYDEYVKFCNQAETMLQQIEKLDVNFFEEVSNLHSGNDDDSE